MHSANLTIMFTDMKGFTSSTAVRSRAEIEKLINLQDKIIPPIIERFGGKIVKTIGDSYMVTFDSPTSAVLCGVRVIVAAAPVFELRVAINVGEVNVKHDDVFGEPVNLAARLETIAEPGDVYLTEAVYLAMNKNETPIIYMGTRTFKGIPRPVKVYKVLLRKNLLEYCKNWISLGYLKYVPLALASLFVIGVFLYWGQKVLADKAAQSQVLSTETSIPASVTPSPTPSSSPTPSPTPPLRQIIIREILVTPKPTSTLTPNPTPTSQRSHKWQK